MNDLEMYREQLAMCDDKLIDALVERNGIIEKIMSYKETYGMPILQPAQEEKQEKGWKKSYREINIRKKSMMYSRGFLRNSKRIQARKLFPYNIVFNRVYGSGKVYDFRLSQHDV